METLIDITTTSFKAIVAVCTVFTAGYAYNSSQDVKISRSLSDVGRKVLLPALVFASFATSNVLTWRHLSMLWPIVVIALTVHLASIAFALLIRRFGTIASWTTESLTMNNTASYPLLLVYALSYASDADSGLSHLKWRILDTTSEVRERAVTYILVNFVITEVARFTLIQLFPSLFTNAEEAESLGVDNANLVQPASADPNEDEAATERTPLVAPTRPTLETRQITWRTFVTPLTLAAVAGLLIGLIKPVQRVVVGEPSTGFWSSIGAGISLLGLTFAVVDTLANGTGVRAGEARQNLEEEVPPALGTVLIITFWRYICVPAFVLPIVHGFRLIPSYKAYPQDPAFSFILALITFTPPSLPSRLSPFRSAVHFWMSYVALITSVAVAIAIAITGRGVSYDTGFDLMRALKSAAGGGVAGAAAMVLQVLSLMPLRTIMNYQYRYGGGFTSSTKKLWADGGIKRYYAGLGAALFQGPLSRFGDTAANAGILALLSSVQWPVLIKTIGGSLASAVFRMTLTPIDTLKTTQQTRGGQAGLKLLKERIKEHGVGCLWWGALATAAATFVGNYPWFATYNWLSETLPPPHDLLQKLARQAFIGFAASVVSDTISNSLRVVKTYRQVHERNVGYWTAAKEIVAAEGILALFGRGLATRLLTNGLQGLLFSILWKLFTDAINGGGK